MVRGIFAAGFVAAVAVNQDHWYTAFHSQPLHNWLNDPNGPMYFNGHYHLFFQYNPSGYNWGNMHWYHQISTDMVHWKHLPVALAPDHDYDCGGIFSGSATIVRNSTTGQDVPILSYSVACGKDIVNAVPADLSDPNLVEWVKPGYNPVIPMPVDQGGGFRDPTTAWQGKDGVWRMLVGCVNSACEFKSKDFVDWSYVGKLHSHGSGMWECPDFYKLPGSDSWLFKASINGDWWTVGDYEEVSDITKPDKFTPRSSGDIYESNQKYDFGTFYASKAFYDPKANREVLFGWVNYHCSGTDWSGVQTFPRSVTVDPLDDTRIMTYPISEIETLRLRTDKVTNVVIKAGSTYTVPHDGVQLDVEVTGRVGASGSFGVRALVSSGSKDAGYAPFEAGWDLMGGDYDVLSDADLVKGCTGDGACPCQARCEADGPDRCTSWTLVGSSFDKQGARCALKSSVPTALERKGQDIISGVASFYAGWDLVGSDYATFTDADLIGSCTHDSCPCQARCEADARCMAWTFVGKGFDSRGARCCLKDSRPAGNHRAGENIVSGVASLGKASGGQAVTVAVANGAGSLDGQAFAIEQGQPVSLRVLVDRSIVEAYAQRGRAVATHTYCKPSADSKGLQVFNAGSEDITVDIVVHQLETANVMPSESILI